MTIRRIGGCVAGIILLVLLIATEAGAQVVNVERYRARRDSLHRWDGQLELGFNLSGREKQVLSLHEASNIVRFSRRHTYLLLNSIDLIKAAGENIESTGYVHGRATFFSRGLFSPEGFLQYQFDHNVGLEYRWLKGTGVRYHLLNARRSDIYLATGLMHEVEEWKVAGQTEHRSNIKSTSYINTSLKPGGRFGASAVIYYQARPVEFFNPRISSEIKINIGLSDHLAFGLAFNATYDNRTVLDVDPFHYALSNTLTISL